MTSYSRRFIKYLDKPTEGDYKKYRWEIGLGGLVMLAGLVGMVALSLLSPPLAPIALFSGFIVGGVVIARGMYEKNRVREDELKWQNTMEGVKEELLEMKSPRKPEDVYKERQYHEQRQLSYLEDIVEKTLANLSRQGIRFGWPGLQNITDRASKNDVRDFVIKELVYYCQCQKNPQELQQTIGSDFSRVRIAQALSDALVVDGKGYVSYKGLENPELINKINGRICGSRNQILAANHSVDMPANGYARAEEQRQSMGVRSR